MHNQINNVRVNSLRTRNMYDMIKELQEKVHAMMLINGVLVVLVAIMILVEVATW